MKTLHTRLASAWLAASLATLMAGCGFHLQGSFELPAVMRETYVEAGDADSLLARKLRRALGETAVVVTQRREEATAVLKLLKDDAGQRVLSVSPTGVPEEYELYHTVSFSLEGAGRTLLEPYETTVTRDYSFDETDVLGKRHEADHLQDAMADDLVQLILRRVALVKTE